MNDTVLIEIQRLFRMVHEHQLSELSTSRPDFALIIKAVPAGSVVMVPAHPPVTPAVAPATQVAALAAPQASAVPSGYAITSPLVGLFYRSSSPDAPPFVEVGDYVEVGQTICIVEAMKVFNEITADHAGLVTAIPAVNGKLVQAGDPLMILDTDAARPSTE
jgi:acetyl-CoA carboxylase biotin carboxyl carrier protein